MAQILGRATIRMFRLTNEPGGLGLSCTPAGVSLAGVPLLRRTRAGFVPRPTSEITALLNAAYGDESIRLQSRLGAIAQALNCGDFATAMMAAIHSRTPELSPGAATRLAKAELELTKYNYNPDEPRDWHGRWTRTKRPIRQARWFPETQAIKRLMTAQGPSISRRGMISCAASSRMRASLNVQKQAFSIPIMVGSFSTASTTA
jgi:hypothetical protein